MFIPVLLCTSDQSSVSKSDNSRPQELNILLLC